LPIPLRIPDREAAKEVVEATYGTGCGMLVRCEVMKTIGYLDDRFFMYYEDADYCRRATQKGFRVFCIPAARMWHRVSASTGQDGANQVFWRARGQAIFYRKHARGGYRMLAHGFVAVKTAAMWFRFISCGLRAQAGSLLRGTWAGYRTQVPPEARSG
jgi:GT2 family glycosyltransferase